MPRRRKPRAAGIVAAATPPRVLAVAFFVALAWWLASAWGTVTHARSPQSPAPAPTPGESFYEPAPPSRTSLGFPGNLPQDITGQVLDRFGRGQPDVLVRISSPGWETFTSTDGLGNFRFTVDEGGFSIDLPRLPSSPVFVTINDFSVVHVVFRERLTSPTPVPATATATPKQTPTPSATPTKVALGFSTPVIVQPTATATPTLEAVGRRSVGSPNIDTASLSTPLFLGGGVALLLFVAGLVLVVVRR